MRGVTSSLQTKEVRSHFLDVYFRDLKQMIQQSDKFEAETYFNHGQPHWEDQQLLLERNMQALTNIEDLENEHFNRLLASRIEDYKENIRNLDLFRKSKGEITQERKELKELLIEKLDTSQKLEESE